MPQLPPVAAAAFVFALLAVILITTVVVQVRARRRRMRLAMMVRETAPIPRPATPRAERAESAELKPSLRGQIYQRAEREGVFEPFDDRSATREGAPGRPGRRLAAQVAHAAGASVSAPPGAPVAIEVVLAATPEVARAGLPAPAGSASTLTHGGLAEVILDLDRPPVAVAVAPGSADVPDAAPSVLGAAKAPASSEPFQEPRREPLRGSRVTVLAPRPPSPALPAFMTREVSLGEAARVLRGSLTMTDGRQLRRAVAVGAATSVVAAAFAIRGRRR